MRLSLCDGRWRLSKLTSDQQSIWNLPLHHGSWPFIYYLASFFVLREEGSAKIVALPRRRRTPLPRRPRGPALQDIITITTPDTAAKMLLGEMVGSL